MSGSVIAVDVGTSGIRAAVITSGGQILASRHLPRGSGVGGDLFDCDTLHQEVLETIAALPAPPDCQALCIAAHIGTVVVDERLRPVGPGGGWADSRGVAELSAQPQEVVRRLLRTAGRPTATAGAVACLLGLGVAERGRIAAVLAPKDFLVARLTGNLATDTVSAAYTLASDVRRREWNLRGLRELGLTAGLFPRQYEPGAVVGGLTGPAAAMTGLPSGLPVVAGGPDGSVAIGLLLGTRLDALADIAGTTDVLARVLPPDMEAPPGAVLNPSVLPGCFTAGGATGLTGGAVSHWRSLLGKVTEDEIGALPPGAQGLTVLPAMTGARFPRWTPGSRGAVLGQRPDHTASHVLMAAREAAAFTVREGLDLLDPDGRLPVVLAGGTVRNENLVRLRADVLSRPLLVSPEPDVTLLGAAALALTAAGLAPDADTLRERLVGTLRPVSPDETRARRYADLYSRWRELHDVCGAGSVSLEAGKTL